MCAALQILKKAINSARTFTINKKEEMAAVIHTVDLQHNPSCHVPI